MATVSSRRARRGDASHTGDRSWERCSSPEGVSLRREGLGDAGSSSTRDAAEAAATRVVPDVAGGRARSWRASGASGRRMCALLASTLIVVWADHAAGAATGKDPGGRSGVRGISMIGGALGMVNELWKSAGGCLPCRIWNGGGQVSRADGGFPTVRALRSSSSMDLIDPGGGTIRPTVPKNSWSMDFFSRGVKSGACGHSLQGRLLVRFSSALDGLTDCFHPKS